MGVDRRYQRCFGSFTLILFYEDTTEEKGGLPDVGLGLKCNLEEKKREEGNGVMILGLEIMSVL